MIKKCDFKSTLFNAQCTSSANIVFINLYKQFLDLFWFDIEKV